MWSNARYVTVLAWRDRGKPRESSGIEDGSLTLESACWVNEAGVWVDAS
jgi:hypothetical protein